ncbi:MAG: GFA family protein [Pseudomonadota bacterium]
MSVVALPIAGGCQCGALRYQLTAPPLMIYACHCTNCQKQSGGAFVMSATVPEAALEFTQGEPARVEWVSDAGNDRFGLFCGACGSRIANGQTPSIGVLSLRAGTFEDTSWVRPAGHIWTRSAQPWMQFGEDDVLCDVQPTDYSSFVSRTRELHNFDAAG